jgi:RNA polymerase sigma factor (sigma-70 family)
MPNALLPRIAVRLSATNDPPDHTLLDRFTADRDAGAFALLVARHGPMVLAVCRRVLGNAPDAEDAFQAAFLVLVRRAADVRQQDRLAGWLYGVAYRTAVEARRLRAKRISRETPTGELPEVPVESPMPDFELATVIERELAGLPDHHRLAVALCDLDGRSRTEAAELLGIPEGTLSSRLNTARKRLAERLSRHGYGACVLTTLATVSSGRANVPWPLTEATTDCATGAAGPNVLSITEGVIRTMSTKWKLLGWVLPALTVAAVVGTATIVSAQTAPPAKAPPKAPPNAAEVEKADPDSPGAKKVSDAPPVVLKTVPAAGAEDVDPATKEVSVTFSKAMTDQSWSWAQDLGRGAALPIGDNKPAFDKDKKTCTLAVKLEPNTTYAVWLNGGRFMSFVDKDGTASLPYLLVFRTGKGK